jgi:hypothetical protein
MQGNLLTLAFASGNVKAAAASQDAMVSHTETESLLRMAYGMSYTSTHNGGAMRCYSQTKFARVSTYRGRMDKNGIGWQRHLRL